MDPALIHKRVLGLILCASTCRPSSATSSHEQPAPRAECQKQIAGWLGADCGYGDRGHASKNRLVQYYSPVWGDAAELIVTNNRLAICSDGRVIGILPRNDCTLNVFPDTKLNRYELPWQGSFDQPISARKKVNETITVKCARVIP